MASAALRDDLDCSICLITYTDPVMLRCGHNFCRVCIDRVLDTQDQSGVYSCPECREEFQQRPTLMRNIALRTIMENFLLTHPTQETRIFCTYCVDSPVPAVKSCLMCEGRVQSLEEHRRKAQEEEAERVTALFIDIRRRLDDLEKRVLSEISRQEKEESLSLSTLIHQLEIKKDKLSRKMRHIEELCNMTDPLTVLQEPDTGDLCDPEEGGGDEDTGGHDKQPHDVDDLDVTVISDTFHTLCDIISGIRIGFYGEDPADILLDVNTASNYLLISDDLKTATEKKISQNRPKTAERFQGYYQVMSSRRFSSGRHYWDVECRSGYWVMGMCYPSIDRRGDQSYSGYNNKSWCMKRWWDNLYIVIHDSKWIQLPDNISSDRFRICLDYGAGQLSFYELCDPIRHLHTFTTTFTEPLHALLCVREGSIKILGGGRSWEKPS